MQKGNYNRGGHQQRRSGGQQQKPNMPPAPKVEESYQKIKQDYTTYAEEVIKIIRNDNRNKIKTNQIRNIYALIIPFFEKLNYGKEIDVEDTKRSLRKVKIKIAYQIGRDKGDLGTKTFNRYSNVLGLIDVILKSNNFKDDLILYCDYFEALVAYHRFYLGEVK